MSVYDEGSLFTYSPQVLRDLVKNVVSLLVEVLTGKENEMEH